MITQKLVNKNINDNYLYYLQYIVLMSIKYFVLAIGSMLVIADL